VRFSTKPSGRGLAKLVTIFRSMALYKCEMAGCTYTVSSCAQHYTERDFMCVADERNPPPLGRIGDMDDIIGSVRVENSQVNEIPLYGLSGPFSSKVTDTT
jgi:hypothetical protein